MKSLYIPIQIQLLHTNTNMILLKANLYILIEISLNFVQLTI